LAAVMTGKGMVEAFSKLANSFSEWMGKDENIKKVQDALTQGQLTGEQIAALKQAELSLKIRMRELDIQEEIEAVITAEEIQAAQVLARKVPVPDHVTDFVLDLVRATRPNEADELPYVKEMLSWGAGPRASQMLVLAGKVRARFHKPSEASYLIMAIVNYTNVCVAMCDYCSFYRLPHDKEGYLLSTDQVCEKINALVQHGGSLVGFNGGFHPKLRIDDYAALFSEVRKRYADLEFYEMTVAEFMFSCKVSKISYDEGGSGWWPGTAINWLEVPQWVQFGLAVSTSPLTNAFLDAIPKGLMLMVGGGLIQASEGKPDTFLAAWAQCCAAGLVPPELLADVVAMANAYGLPAEFVAALSD
jgi:hypothetical protein